MERIMKAIRIKIAEVEHHIIFAVWGMLPVAAKGAVYTFWRAHRRNHCFKK
jgi:hypothetical protein